MELIEELYRDNGIKADCKLKEECVGNYNQANEPPIHYDNS